VWAADANPLRGFPPDHPRPGTIHIDFTHDFPADPASANRQRWQWRLEHIAGHFGADGDDSMWCAPTPAITAYVQAARSAQVTATREALQVSLPDLTAGTPLTIRLDHVPEGMAFTTPAGGTIHRHGDRAWITTAMLGAPGIPPPSPACTRILRSHGLSATFTTPIRLAGVRLLHSGEPHPDWRVRITVTTPDGSRHDLAISGEGKLAANPGIWRLFPVVPDGDAITVTALSVAPDPCVRALEIWALTGTGK